MIGGIDMIGSATEAIRCDIPGRVILRDGFIKGWNRGVGGYAAVAANNGANIYSTSSLFFEGAIPGDPNPYGGFGGPQYGTYNGGKIYKDGTLVAG